VLLQHALLPRPPDRKRDARRLDVDEERLAVGAEGRARELPAFKARHEVAREVEDLSLARQAADELIGGVPVFADYQMAARADAEIVGHIQHRLFPRFVDELELAFVFARRNVLPDLAEFAVAAAGRREEDTVAAVPAAFEPRKGRAAFREALPVNASCRQIGIHCVPSARTASRPAFDRSADRIDCDR